MNYSAVTPGISSTRTGRCVQVNETPHLIHILSFVQASLSKT